VASPKATAKSPVASGSKVPAWPAFLALKSQRTLLTTALEEIPACLFTKTQHEIFSPDRRRDNKNSVKILKTVIFFLLSRMLIDRFLTNYYYPY
jgi:hypothetical protein